MPKFKIIVQRTTRETLIIESDTTEAEIRNLFHSDPDEFEEWSSGPIDFETLDTELRGIEQLDGA